MVLDILEDLCNALEWLHAQSGNKPRMAHGDLHSGNVMLDLSRPVPDGRYPHIRVLDFGMTSWADSHDTLEQHIEVTIEQHKDIDFVGTIIHDLACNDLRHLGFHDGYSSDQISHCHHNSTPGKETSCRRQNDPNSTLFRDEEPLWYFVNNCMIVKRGAALCDKIETWSMADVNAYIQPMIAEARKHEASIPHFKETYELTTSYLQTMVISHAMLPPEYVGQPQVVPGAQEAQPPSQMDRKISSQLSSEAESLPSPGHCLQGDTAKIMCRKPAGQHIGCAQKPGALYFHRKALEPPVVCGIERTKVDPSSTHNYQGKRTRTQMDVDESLGIDEPFAKRLCGGLTDEIAQMTDWLVHTTRIVSGVNHQPSMRIQTSLAGGYSQFEVGGCGPGIAKLFRPHHVDGKFLCENMR